jgi:tetratricopeptide (TPR) repeat protein
MKKSLSLCILAFSLAAALSVGPAMADYKQAVAFYNQGKYAEAIQELKPDIEQNPNWEFGHRLLGLCFLNLDNNALAVSSFTRAAELKSEAFITYYGLGRAYCNMQKYDRCISALDQAEPLADKEKQPELQKAKVYKLRGSAYYRLEKYDAAVNDLTNAIRVDPSDWADFSMLGASYFRLNRDDEAIQALEKALSMKPGQSATAELLGKTYFKKGIDSLSSKQYAETVEALLKAKEFDPKNGYIYYNLAEAFRAQKKYSDAEKALIQAVELMPQSPDVYRRMGLVYEMQKKWDPALKAYKKAEALSPSKSSKEAIERVENNMKQ